MWHALTERKYRYMKVHVYVYLDLNMLAKGSNKKDWVLKKWLISRCFCWMSEKNIMFMKKSKINLNLDIEQPQWNFHSLMPEHLSRSRIVYLKNRLGILYMYCTYCKRGYIDEFKIWRFFSKRQLTSFNFDEFLNKSKSFLSLISYNARVRVIFLWLNCILRLESSLLNCNN